MNISLVFYMMENCFEFLRDNFSIFRWFMNLNYKTATRYYIKANETMKENITRTPSLFIFSKTDPVSDESVNMPFVQKYESMGLEVMVENTFS